MCYSSMKCFQMVFTLPEGMEKVLYKIVKLYRNIWWIIMTMRASSNILIITMVDPTNRNFISPWTTLITVIMLLLHDNKNIIISIYCPFEPIWAELSLNILFLNVLEYFFYLLIFIYFIRNFIFPTIIMFIYDYIRVSPSLFLCNTNFKLNQIFYLYVRHCYWSHW